MILIIYCCLDCANKISKSSALFGNGRCRVCARKASKHNIIYCCMDCDDKISKTSAIYGNGRCLKCGGINRRGIKVQRKSYKGKNNPNYKNGNCLKEYFCACGNKVTIANGLYGSRTCQSCRTLNFWKNGYFNKRSFKGNKNPNYINGLSKTKYPNKFKRIRILIRKRDNFVCQCCGLTETASLKKFDEVLHVHHIDYNKENCNKNNLITLCKSCNVKANGNKELDRNYWFAYYIWIMENKNDR